MFNDKFKLVIFDWDGTLMDSTHKIVKAMQNAAPSVGLLPLAPSEIRHIIGLGLSEALDILYPDALKDQKIAMKEAYSNSYIELEKIPCHLFDGVETMINQLSEYGKILSIATGKSRRGLDRVLPNTDISTLFASSRCADETHSKPHPKMLNELLALHNISPDSAVMIGDSTYDLEMAANAGIASIGVSWGVHSEEQLSIHSPIKVAKSVDDLKGLL